MPPEPWGDLQPTLSMVWIRPWVSGMDDDRVSHCCSYFESLYHNLSHTYHLTAVYLYRWSSKGLRSTKLFRFLTPDTMWSIFTYNFYHFHHSDFLLVLATAESWKRQRSPDFKHAFKISLSQQIHFTSGLDYIFVSIPALITGYFSSELPQRMMLFFVQSKSGVLNIPIWSFQPLHTELDQICNVIRSFL